MEENDTALFRPGDIFAAIGFLTRLPVSADGTRGAAIVWAYPLAGAVVGVIAALVGAIALGLGVPVTVAAGLALATSVIVTGALHEDGLADCADGFWGGYDRERRLEIMKDSRIGAYGVIALVLSLLLRWAALVAILNAGGWIWGVLIAVGAIARAPMGVLMAFLPPARPGGLSSSVGRPEPLVALSGLAIAAVIGLLLTGWAIFPIVLVVAGVATLVARLSLAKIDGQTGDVLGACQQLSELSVLIVLAAIW